MLSLWIELEGKQARGMEGGSIQAGIPAISPPPPVFPLIRKAFCKSSYSEIRGSEKDCMVECYNLLPQRLVSLDRKPLG